MKLLSQTELKIIHGGALDLDALKAFGICGAVGAAVGLSTSVARKNLIGTNSVSHTFEAYAGAAQVSAIFIAINVMDAVGL